MIQNYDFRTAAASRFILPPLPFKYDELEPFLTSEIIEIHHQKHHKSYVDGLNRCLDELDEARSKNDFQHIKGVERNLAFNYSGHILHTLYWDTLNPSTSGITSEMQSRIIEDFGSLEAFKTQFVEAGKAAEGSAWVLLVSDRLTNMLMLSVVENHQNMAMHAVNIHMVCDVWEHAYYLKYKNDRESYLKGFIEIASIR